MPVRIGVAIGIPPPWGEWLDQARARAGDPQAPLVPAHVTLLGPTEVTRQALPEIERHLIGVAGAVDRFGLELAGAGTFRPVTDVVFVAVAGGAQHCAGLATAVRSGPLAGPPPRYPYHPHVTVAHDLAAEALDAAYADLAGFAARFEVVQFTLWVHGREGRWRPVRHFPLRQTCTVAGQRP